MQTSLIILYALLIIQSAFLIHIGLQILAVNKVSDKKELEFRKEWATKPLFKAKPKPTEEEIKYEKILTNIDNYNGTPERQVKV